MKRLSYLATVQVFLVLLVCFGIRAIAGSPDDCYVKTSDNTFAGKDIKIGLTHTKIIFEDGTYKSIKNRKIIAYRHHDKLFMMMPVVCNNTDTLCMAMMEYVTSKSGCLVFKYCCSRDDDRLTDVKRNYFFVYKDGKYYKRIDEDQTEALLAFGIKVI
jgi:hypothetical protein